MPSGFVVIDIHVFKNGLTHGFQIHKWIIPDGLNSQRMEDAFLASEAFDQLL